VGFGADADRGIILAREDWRDPGVVDALAVVPA
jgi:hypothetical protein